MKKLVSLIAAATLALGLMSCDGGMHNQGELDLSTVFLRGKMNGYGTTDLKKSDDGTYKVSFTASSSSDDFAIATSDGTWSTAYRGTAAGALATVSVGTPIDLYVLDSPSCAPISGVKTGTTYNMSITPQVGYLTVLIEEGVTPPSFYVVSGAAMKMDNVGAGVYGKTITATGSTYEFQLLKREEKAEDVSFVAKKGINPNDDDGSKIELSRCFFGETISIKGLEKGKKYQIIVDYTNPYVPLIQVCPTILSRGALVGTVSDWDGNTLMSALKEDDTTYRYEFIASEKDMSFSIQEVAGSWSSRWCGGTGGTVKPICFDAPKELSAQTDSQNLVYVEGGDPPHCKLQGLAVGATYAIAVKIENAEKKEVSAMLSYIKAPAANVTMTISKITVDLTNNKNIPLPADGTIYLRGAFNGGKWGSPDEFPVEVKNGKIEATGTFKFTGPLGSNQGIKFYSVKNSWEGGWCISGDGNDNFSGNFKVTIVEGRTELHLKVEGYDPNEGGSHGYYCKLIP